MEVTGAAQLYRAASGGPQGYASCLTPPQQLGDFGCDFLDGVGCRAASDLICKRWTKVDDLLLCYVVPDRQKYLLTGHSASNNSVKFVVCPSLRYKRRREDDQPNAAFRQAFVDFLSQAIADAEGEFVVPNLEPFAD